MPQSVRLWGREVLEGSHRGLVAVGLGALQAGVPMGRALQEI